MWGQVRQESSLGIEFLMSPAVREGYLFMLELHDEYLGSTKLIYFLPCAFGIFH